MGWEDTETEIGRSEKTYGIFLSISNNLQFTGQGKDFIETTYQIYGVQAKVQLTKLVKHPHTDEWQLAYTGYLDFTSRKIEDGKLKVDFYEGGLREILASQMREKFELNRAESIDGAVITPLERDLLTLRGREIYLLSKLSNEGNLDFWVRSGKWNSNDYREVVQAFPMQVVALADADNISEQTESFRNDGTDALNASAMFFTIADRNRGACHLNFNASFKMSLDSFGSNMENVTLDVVIRRYSGNENEWVMEQEYPVQNLAFWNATNDYYNDRGRSWNVNYSADFEPKIGESFSIGLKLRGIYGKGLNSAGEVQLKLEEYKANLSWEEDSWFDPSEAPCIRAFDLGQRLTEIFTGIPKFYSDLLTTNDSWKDLCFSCGGWIRNLRIKTETGELKDWPMTISFEQFYKSIHAVLPVGYGIVKKGAKQFIALEELRYFFQTKVLIQLGQVSKVKRETVDDFCYSSLSFGYTEGGNYEAPLGLDEYNIETTYTTPITVTDKNYEALGPSRADIYAVEQARRKPYLEYPDEDTPYDKHNFLLDAKFIVRSNFRDYFELRLWADDFEQAPTGVYSPNTAANLRISPANNRNRHSYWFNSATVKHPTDKMRYANSEGNSELKTKFPGEPEVKENADVSIGDLSNPLFEPEYIEFEHPYSQDILNQLQGTTVINGKEINNYYGLVEFTNENNQRERGFLMSAKIKNTIKFKILKSYGI